MSNLTYNYIKMGKKVKKSFTHSFLRVFMFQSCRLPSEKPTASWLVRWMYCRAVASVPVGLLIWRHRCLPCCVTPSRNRGISDGDLSTTSRSVAKTNENGLKLWKGFLLFTWKLLPKKQQSHLKPPVRSDYRTGHPDKDQPAVHDRRLWPQQPHRRTSADSGADAAC